jgi:hypothetical protein
VADALRREPGLAVELVDGNPGEFTVLVGGRVLARKQGNDLPPIEQVVAAVREAGMPAAGKRT